VHVRSWQAAYRTLLPEDYLNQLCAEDRARQYDFTGLDPMKPRTIVAEEEGAIYGFASTVPSLDPDLANHGELCALYADPEQWGRGIGAALISAARAHLFAAGFRHALLWILAGNVRAERFYQIDGWSCDGVRRTVSMWGITVDEVRFRRKLDAPRSDSAS
jgi:GNAT superfamily N-acetyltransferase